MFTSISKGRNMEINNKDEITFLNEFAELGNLLFWKYNCESGQLILSNQIVSYFQKTSSPVSEQEKSECFSKYMDAIFSEEQEAFRQMIYGKHESQTGMLNYHVLISENILCHQCKFLKTTENGKKFIVGSITDNTEELLLKKKLEKKEFILEHIVNRADMGIYIWNPLSKEVEVNSKWYENFGLDPQTPFEEAMKEFTAHIHPIDRGRIEFICDQFRTREIKYMDEDFRICINGSIHWVRYTILSHVTNQPNNNIRLIGLNQDVTPLKKQEERNSKIIEALPDFIFIFDEHFFIRDLLKSDTIILLHPLEELLGADGRHIFSPEVSRMYIEAIYNCLNQNILQEIEYYLDANGERYYFQARMVPFDGNRVMALIHDIGDRVKRTQELIQAKQKAEESDRMKSAFLANMSHEIRTPLNAIVGFSEIITTTESLIDKETYVDIIKTNSSILLQLINDILDLSRIESEKTEINIQKVEMNTILEEVAQVHRLKLKKDIELKVEYPQHLVYTKTDQNRVNQVLFNFMSNAIKHTEKGHITLSFSLKNNQIHLAVSDTGRGIPRDRLNSIFERFTKLDDFVQGTGLGLTICKTIAEKLNGRIDVESEYGQGSTFTLVLPYIPA